MSDHLSPARPDPLLTATGLTKSYASGGRLVDAVHEVDLTVDTGEWVSIMGPSGCGKSTLLHLLGGLDAPDGGSVSIAGEPVTGRSESARAVLRRRLVGYVFQFYNLVPDLSAGENVELAAQLAGASRRDARARTLELFDELDLGDVGGASPAELSGGQQQRVALARALVNRPPLLLADEPTGALDTEAARTVLGVLRREHDAGQTIVLVTHDHRVAAAADRVLVMQDGAMRDERRLSAPGTLLSGLIPLELS
jgi:putative ABC transport system ATP-binding protein